MTKIEFWKDTKKSYLKLIEWMKNFKDEMPFGCEIAIHENVKLVFNDEGILSLLLYYPKNNPKFLKASNANGFILQMEENETDNTDNIMSIAINEKGLAYFVKGLPEIDKVTSFFELNEYYFIKDNIVPIDNFPIEQLRFTIVSFDMIKEYIANYLNVTDMISIFDPYSNNDKLNNKNNDQTRN